MRSGQSDGPNLDCLGRTKGMSGSLHGAEEHVKGGVPSHLAIGQGRKKV